MARLTRTEQRRLGRLRPETMELLLQLLDAAALELGFSLYVPDKGGTRSIAEQEELYRAALVAGGGRQTAYAVAAPGQSRHNYGAAFDVHIFAGGAGPNGTGTDDDYRQLAELGERLGLTAGYYFDAREMGKHDPYHFQLNEPFNASVDRWKAMQLAGIVKTLSVVAIAAALFGG